MKSVLLIILIFLIIQIIGLYIGNIYVQAIKAEVLEPPEVIPGVSSESPQISFFLFAYIIGVTAVILFIIRIRKSFLRGVEAFVVFISSWLTFSFLIPFQIQAVWGDFIAHLLSPLGSMGFIFFYVLTPDFILALILTVWKVFRPTFFSQNVAAIFSGSGVGALLGVSLGIAPCIIFMMILSVYDFVSVFITKHMVKMAKAITERPMAFTIAAPHKFKKAKYIPHKGAKKKVHVFQLGLGDIILPLMFSVSILNKFTILHSIITIIGSLIGLLFLTVYITRKPRALPALPFVCSGTLAGYIVSMLIL
ncbi:MAG: presenilin family intramembrane aspartyl protease [Candidatus Thorarchaeota archaeon]